MIYILYIIVIHVLYSFFFINILGMLWTCSGHVSEKFWGSKIFVSKKFRGPLGYVLAPSEVPFKGSFRGPYRPKIGEKWGKMENEKVAK